MTEEFEDPPKPIQWLVAGSIFVVGILVAHFEKIAAVIAAAMVVIFVDIYWETIVAPFALVASALAPVAGPIIAVAVALILAVTGVGYVLVEHVEGGDSDGE